LHRAAPPQVWRRWKLLSPREAVQYLGRKRRARVRLLPELVLFAL
jgi:hypothetical protein